jgi:hypothetical protein
VSYVQTLSGYVVKGAVANTRYQGNLLGNLEVGSTEEHLDNLVNKWFRGTDLPTVTQLNKGTVQNPDYYFPEYREVAGELFVKGPSFTDANYPQNNPVNQGQLGDCFYLASLAAIARKSARPIEDMFIDNGDGTFTVRFYNNGDSKSVYFVTVDRQLPTDADGKLVYAGYGKLYSDTNNELWVELAEKAYAQVAEFGWVKAGPAYMHGLNAYGAIEGGLPGDAMSDILGRPSNAADVGRTTPWDAIRRFQLGAPVSFGSPENSIDPRVPSNHAYAMLDYDLAGQRIKIFNPWGTDSGEAEAKFWLSFREVVSIFDAWWDGAVVR